MIQSIIKNYLHNGKLNLYYLSVMYNNFVYRLTLTHFILVLNKK